MTLLSLMPPATTPAERFARIVAWVLAAVGASVERPALNKPGLPEPLARLIWSRLNRMAQRITRLAARVAAGTLKPPRPRTARARPRPAKPSPALGLPRGRAWLMQLVPGIGFGASQLGALLAEPEMQALLAAAPQIKRTLRPYWHMFTTAPLPPILQRPKPDKPPAEESPLPPTVGGERWVKEAVRQTPCLQQGIHPHPNPPPRAGEGKGGKRDVPAPEVAGPTSVLPASA